MTEEIKSQLLHIVKNILSERKTHSDRDPMWCYYHCLRTAEISLKLRPLVLPENPEYDQIIYTSALFHDVAKDRQNHEKEGAALAGRLLKDIIPKDELEKIIFTIAVHDTRDKSAEYPAYVKIVQDADLIDHDGIIDIWNNFYYCGVNGYSIDYSIDYFYNVSAKEHGIRHYDMLNFKEFGDILDKRFDYIYSFFEKLKTIQNGELL